MIRVGNVSFNQSSIEICAGDNVQITADADNGRLFISAPNINKTNLKQGPFLLSGEHIEICAGKNIEITSIHPNTLIIGADISKEQLKIIELNKRIENLEKVIAVLLKDKKK